MAIHIIFVFLNSINIIDMKLGPSKSLLYESRNLVIVTSKQGKCIQVLSLVSAHQCDLR